MTGAVGDGVYLGQTHRRHSVKNIDKETLNREIRQDLKRYADQDVVFVHADADEVDRVAGKVIEKHHKTIKELADR